MVKSELLHRMFETHTDRSIQLFSFLSNHAHRFPLELHVVFFNMRLFDNATDAMKSNSSDALLVLATLFKTTSDKNTIFDFTKEFRRIVKFEKCLNHNCNGRPFTKLLPNNIERYYTYQGSLTTPPCSVIAIWVLFKENIYISKRQLRDFAHIHNFENKVVKYNNRELQANNGRKVFINNPEGNERKRIVQTVHEDGTSQTVQKVETVQTTQKAQAAQTHHNDETMKDFFEIRISVRPNEMV